MVRGWRGNAPSELHAFSIPKGRSVLAFTLSLGMRILGETRQDELPETLAALDIIRELVEARAGW